MSNVVEDYQALVTHCENLGLKYNYKSFALVDSIVYTICVRTEKKKLTSSEIIEDIPKLILFNFGFLWDLVLSEHKIDTLNDVGNVLQLFIEHKLYKSDETDKISDFYDEEKKQSLFSRIKQKEINSIGEILDGQITRMCSRYSEGRAIFHKEGQ